MKEETLTTKKLFKDFDGVRAVNNVSLSFHSGKVTSLIGPNGSGKSTFINLVTGMTPITSGEVLIAGSESMTNIRPRDISFFGMTRTFQNIRLFEQMPVLDNILLTLTERNVFKSIFERHKKFHLEKAEKVLRRVGLWNKRNDLAVNLSYGQRKLLEIGRVLAMDERTDGDANIFFFDEPFAGLFPEMRKVVVSVIKELCDKGKTVLLVEHNMDLIRELSDHVYVLDAGQLLAEGTAEEVLSDKEVVEAYLGD
jgi:ABC-type branched-subunit amino acid transport system ATPase component